MSRSGHLGHLRRACFVPAPVTRYECLRPARSAGRHLLGAMAPGSRPGSRGGASGGLFLPQHYTPQPPGPSTGASSARPSTGDRGVSSREGRGAVGRSLDAAGWLLRTTTRTHNAARLTTHLQGGCSYRRADPVRVGQTVVRACTLGPFSVCRPSQRRSSRRSVTLLRGGPRGGQRRRRRRRGAAAGVRGVPR